MQRNTENMGLICGLVALVCFLVAALCWPGGGYDPFMRMLSSLGRTEINGVSHPLCRYLFISGMVFAAMGVAAVFWNASTRLSGWRRRCTRYGVAANIAGLVTIALSQNDATELAEASSPFATVAICRSWMLTSSFQ